MMVYCVMYKRTHIFMCFTAFFIHTLFQQQYYTLYVWRIILLWCCMRRSTPFYYKKLSIPPYQYQVTWNSLVPLRIMFLSTNYVIMTQASMNISGSLFYQIKPRLRIHYHYRLQIHAFIVIVTLMLFATAFKKKGL